MNGPQHYAEAAELVEKATRSGAAGTPASEAWLKAAEVHAHLARTAVLAAQSMSSPAQITLNREWYEALGGDMVAAR